MFANAGSLKSFPDISFDSAVTISSMFSGASSLETVGNISMPAAPPNNGLQYMFQSCSKLKTVGDITVGNNESVGCASMFNGCSNLENIGALNFKPNYAYQMFYGCSSLKEVPKMDLSECTYISNMFQGCTGLNGTVNIGKHNSTRNISNTFGGCKNIKAIEDFYVSSTSYVAGGTTFPVGSATDIVALKRLTIHPEATYTGFTFNLSFCSFERSGMVEFFNSLLDITDSTASSSYKTITITGNPCVLDGYSLSKNTAYSTYKTHEALIEYAIKRYRGFDCQGAPIKYYLSGGSSNSAVEGVFSDITTDMFDAGNVYVQFLADTISVPEDQRLSDSDKQIAIDKGWTLKI